MSGSNSTIDITASAVVGPERHRIYINEQSEATLAVEKMLKALRSGKFRTDVGFDIETSPEHGLEAYEGAPDSGYPGTQEGVKATKAQYLKFAQWSWLGSFNPAKLSALNLYVPEKTTSGKEGELSAGEAWLAFLDGITGLEASEEGRAALESCRWTLSEIDAYQRVRALDRLVLEAKVAKYRQMVERAKTDDTRAKHAKTLENTEAALAEFDIFTGAWHKYALDRLKTPVDLRLLTHVVKVGAEGRTKLDNRGQNVRDPVRPGLDPFTTTIFLTQFTLKRKGTGELFSYVINTNEGKVSPKTFAPLFREKGLEFIGANIGFDLAFSMVHVGVAPKLVFDTHIANRLMTMGVENVRNSLAENAKRYLGLDLSKEARVSFVGHRYDEPTAEQVEYSYFDTEVLHDLKDAQLRKARKLGQEELISTFSRLSWIVAKWKVEGYRIDPVRWLEIAKGAANLRDKYARELEQMLLPPEYANLYDTAEEDGEIDDDGNEDVEEDVRKNAIIRISQTAQVKKELERLLGLGPLENLEMFKKSGKVSLDKTNRQLLDYEYRKRNDGVGHPFFTLYALWSKLSTQTKTFGKSYLWSIHPLTGVIHPNITIAGTDTARMKSSSPNFFNIPAAKEEGDADFRGAFMSPEGHYLLGGDYESMELRIAFNMFEDVVGRAMVESGVDGHGFSAAMMFHIRRSAEVSAPASETVVYERGTTKTPIALFRVPQSWSDERVAEFALTEEVQKAVTSVEKKLTRVDAKTVTFLFLFQGTSFTLAQRTGLPLKVCDEFFRQFANTYSGMDKGMKELAEVAVTENVVQAANGDLYAFSVGYGNVRRWVKLPTSPHYEWFSNEADWKEAERQYRRLIKRCQRELCNVPMQSSNAVITAEALVALADQGEETGVYPWASFYDEVICVAPDSVPPETVKALGETAMKDAAGRYMHFVKAGVEFDVAKAGKTWKKS